MKWHNILVSCLIFLLQVAFLAESARCDEVVVGDDQLQIALSYNAQGLRETEFSVSGKKLVALTGPRGSSRRTAAWSNPTRATSGCWERRKIPGRKPPSPGRTTPSSGSSPMKPAGNGRITKQLSIVARQDVVLQRIMLFDAKSKTRPLVSSTSLSDIAAFFREGKAGMFASLDFPYSAIAIDGANIRIAYPPFYKAKVFGKIRLSFAHARRHAACRPGALRLRRRGSGGDGLIHSGALSPQVRPAHVRLVRHRQPVYDASQRHRLVYDEGPSDPGFSYRSLDARDRVDAETRDGILPVISRGRSTPCPTIRIPRLWRRS